MYEIVKRFLSSPPSSLLGIYIVPCAAYPDPGERTPGYVYSEKLKAL